MSLHRITPVVVLAISLYTISCGGSGSGTGGSGGTATANSSSASSSGSAQGGATSSSATVVFNTSASGSTGSQVQSLTVEPVDGTLTLDVLFGTPGPSKAFVAKDGSGQPVAAQWVVSDPARGQIDASTGIFSASGNAGGELRIIASTAGASGEATLFLRLTVEEGTASPSDKDKLRAPGGTTEPGFRIVYPYTDTVFARGTVPPEVQFEGTLGTLYYLKLTGQNGCNYEGFLGSVPASGSTPANSKGVRMSQAAWDALGTCSDGKAMGAVFAKLTAGQKRGPLTQNWILSKGTLKGTIHYNTYDSLLAQVPCDDVPANMCASGAVMRIRGTDATPHMVTKDCIVCHSVSGNGAVLAAMARKAPATEGGLFSLAANPDDPPIIAPTTIGDATFSFAGLSHDGAVAFTQGGGIGGWNARSQLYTASGTLIPASGIEDKMAQTTPAFSPDGTKVAFVDRGVSACAPNGGGAFPHETCTKNSEPGPIVVCSYNKITQKISGCATVITPPAGSAFGWPSFTPDGKWIVFQDGPSGEHELTTRPRGYIRMVNVASHTINTLALANGDATWLPAGVRDEHYNYEGTVAPVASGGYFWSVFTSRRTYGNRLIGDPYGGSDPFGEPTPSTKRLWITAININAVDGADPSHPPFYLANQELASGNSRGFFTLAPCKGDGASSSCASGDECCNGYCLPTPGNPTVFACGTPPVPTCSAEGDRCETSADCCNSSDLCITGFCALPVPP